MPQKMLLTILKIQVVENISFELQFRLKTACMNVVIQIISSAHCRDYNINSFDSVLINEPLYGLAASQECVTLQLQADILTTPWLLQLARLSASLPRSHCISQIPLNAVLFHMLQMLINAFNVLQYNDYCGDDCTTDSSGQHSYTFEVSGSAINALE